jgi:hypothetical protein
MNPQEIHYYQTEKQVEAVAVIRVSHRLKTSVQVVQSTVGTQRKWLAGWLAIVLLTLTSKGSTPSTIQSD